MWWQGVRQVHTRHQCIGDERCSEGGCAGFGWVMEVASHQQAGVEGEDIAQHPNQGQQGEENAAQYHQDAILQRLHHHLQRGSVQR